MINISEIESYKDYGRVLNITNGVIEAFVTLDLGPRVIRFGFVGGQNIMNANRDEFEPKDDKEFEDFFGKGRKWENFGGHRIWTSPEAYPDTYYPDSDKVDYQITDNGVIFTPKPEVETGYQKKLELKMDNDDSNMLVTMYVTNIGDKAKDFSVWGLSVCEKGGALIIPTNTNDTGLLPNRTISVWPYSDLSDSRLHFGKKYVVLKQENNTQPMKLGFNLNNSTVFYCLNDDIFCKTYENEHPSANYPDGGVSFETYTNEAFIEVETLSPLRTYAPGETAVLRERWSLYKKPCEVDLKDDLSIDNLIDKIGD